MLQGEIVMAHLETVRVKVRNAWFAGCREDL